MEWPLVYRLWQAPFAEGKLRPVLNAMQIRPPCRVLDIGCGPGTNAHHFSNVDYLGIDINEHYIDTAIRRHGNRFMVADAANLAGTDLRGGWDFVLINSLLHHLSDNEVHALLAAVPGLLSDGGRVHILDLVLPHKRRLSHLLARLDRGRYPRRLEKWRELFLSHLQVESFMSFPLGFRILEMWSMVYCVGTRRMA